MFTKKILTIIFFAFFAPAFLVSETKAQTATTFVTGLKAPTKIIYAPRQGYFLVSEGGDAQIPNSGRISIVTNAGLRFTLIDGLPSGTAPPNNDVIGPTALWLNDDNLYIAIGGNETLAGPAPGTEIPNPNPNSPIFSSVLKLNLSANPFLFRF